MAKSSKLPNRGKSPIAPKPPRTPRISMNLTHDELEEEAICRGHDPESLVHYKKKELLYFLTDGSINLSKTTAWKELCALKEQMEQERPELVLKQERERQKDDSGKATPWSYTEWREQLELCYDKVLRREANSVRDYCVKTFRDGNETQRQRNFQRVFKDAGLDVMIYKDKGTKTKQVQACLDQWVDKMIEKEKKKRKARKRVERDADGEAQGPSKKAAPSTAATSQAVPALTTLAEVSAATPTKPPAKAS